MPTKMLGRWVLLLLAVPSVANAASNSFPSHVQAAIMRVLESENLTLSTIGEAQFVRYAIGGKVEAFHCPSMVRFKFYPFRSDMGGGVTVGECPKDPQLGEDMSARQLREFEAALSAWQGIYGKATVERLREAGKPQQVREGNVAYFHITQFFIPDGAIGETLLMIPSDSATVYLVQGSLPESACRPAAKLSLCDDFRAALREVAKQARAAQAARASARPSIEPLRPGRPTICDGIVHTVADALEQSEERRAPVTETIRYKQLEGQPDIQSFMRDAAEERARGVEIHAAARNAGEACLRKWFASPKR